jgi:hypothetical protein
MEPWLFGMELDGPSELSEGFVNLLALEMCFAEVGVRFHKAWINFGGSFERRCSSIEVVGFSARLSLLTTLEILSCLL